MHVRRWRPIPADKTLHAGHLLPRAVTEGVRRYSSDYSGPQGEIVESDESIRLNRELIEFLNELRVLLPGVTVLFSFLLAVSVYVGFHTADAPQDSVDFCAF